MMWFGNDKIFRTYLKGGGKDGKRCVDSHKGIPNVRTWDDACQFSSFGGVLQPGFVDISFDDKDMSQTFLDMAKDMGWRCMCLKNPTSGHVHSFWKDTTHKISKDGKDLPLAVGLVADVHSGETYIPLRVLNVDRFPPVLDTGEYQEIPDELIPVKTNIKLWNCIEGGGRNENLFSYIMVLQSQLNLDDERIRQMYRECINPYILAEELPESELETILRDEAFENRPLPVFWNRASFLHQTFAAYLMDTYNLCMVNGILHVYKNGVYVSTLRDLERIMIQIEPKLKDTHRKEVIKYLEISSKVKDMADPRYIAFKNGVYDIVEDTMISFSPDLVITNQIPWDYDETAYDGNTDRILDNLACHDVEIRKILEECIGACMYRSALLAGGKAFILTGDKANGKSTFLDMIKYLIGDANVSSLDLKEIGDRFNTAMIAGKLVNIGDDISDEFLHGNQVSIFKKIVTGNRIKAEYKGLTPFDLDPYCKLLFSANDIPRIRDRSGAAMRRLVIVPFKAKFTKEDPDFDPFIIQKLKKESSMKYLARLGVIGLRRVLESNQFTQSSQVQREMEQYEIENDSILGFLHDMDLEDTLKCTTDEVYSAYKLFCQDSNTLPLQKAVFSKQLTRKLDLVVIRTRISGKQIRYYARKKT